MVDCTPFTNYGIRVKDDSPKVMNAHTFSDPHSHWYRNSGRDLDDSLAKEP
jgi:hypothetical protein